MMKKIIYIVLLCLPVYSYSQNYYQKQVEGHNFPDSIYKNFYPDGTLGNIFPIKKGKIEGELSIYSRRGEIILIANFIGGRYNGKVLNYGTNRKNWHRIKGSMLLYDLDFRNDTLIKRTSYFPYGKKKVVCSWEYNQTINQLSKREFKRYITCTKNKEFYFHDIAGKYGYEVKYYQNGNKQEEGQLIKYKKDGVWIYYTEDGKEKNRITYLKGKKINQPDNLSK